MATPRSAAEAADGAGDAIQTLDTKAAEAIDAARAEGERFRLAGFVPQAERFDSIQASLGELRAAISSLPAELHHDGTQLAAMVKVETARDIDKTLTSAGADLDNSATAWDVVKQHLAAATATFEDAATRRRRLADSPASQALEAVATALASTTVTDASDEVQTLDTETRAHWD